MKASMSPSRSLFGNAVLLLALLPLASCERDVPTALEQRVINFGKGGGGGASGDPTVTSTDPAGAPRDTTLDVRVFGTNFDRGSRVDFALNGVPSPKVTTNSTRFVRSTELVANVTIAPDAVEDLYDVIATASSGKKGIGTELFVITDQWTVTLSRPPDTVGDATWRGLITDASCNGTGYLVVTRGHHPSLSTGASDPTGTAPDLNLMIVNSGRTWTRTYDAGRTLGELSPEPNFSPFDGCYGETVADPTTGNVGYAGNIFISFETNKSQPTVRFTWHYDYYNRPGVEPFEYFTLWSDKIPIAQKWTGGSMTVRVNGMFDIKRRDQVVRNNAPLTIRLDFILNVEPKFD